MYKRPIPRTRGTGTLIGPPTVPAPNVMGEILAKMHTTSTPRRPPPKPWTPPYDYEFYARHLDDPKPFLKRVAEFHEANPIPEPPVAVTHTNYNFEPIHKLFSKYNSRRPPVEEHVKALKEAGYSEERIERLRQYHQNMEDTADERQEKLDAIFAKWPSSGKTAAKPKPAKPIKAVKKKMPPT